MRIPDNPWKPAMERATREGTTLTAVVIAFLRRYAAGAAVLALVMASVSSSAQASAPAVTAAPMSATSTFVATVRQIGAGTTIADQTDAYLVRAGRSVCASLDSGATRQTMWAQVSGYYDPSAFQGLLQASILTFCPAHLGAL